MKIKPLGRCLIIVLALAAAGCTGHLTPKAPPPQDQQRQPFVIVTATAKDSLASLAAKHLNDPGRAWQIAAYNEIKTLEPGQLVVIPLIQPKPGGIGPEGYQKVPVLLYTRLADQPTNAHTVSTRTFERQMAYLADNGFNTVSLVWLLRFFQFKEQPPPKAVVVTFDSSQRWVYEIAYPVLKRRGMRGAVFVHSSAIGRDGNLTWRQLADMSANGFEIGALGGAGDAPGPNDPRKRLKALEAGLVEPCKAFKRHLKQACRFYAYADGRADDLTIALLKRHGYHCAFTRIRGSNPFFAENFHIRRSLIYGNYDMDQFRNNLATFHKVDLK